jgi:hypothetical protein
MTPFDSRIPVRSRAAVYGCIAMALAFTQACPAVVGAADRYDGLAYASRSGALVYRETHWRYMDRGTNARLVVYRCPSGDAFARKEVFDRSRGTAPDFDFFDARDGYREGVRTQAGRREVFWQPGRDATSVKRTIDVGARTVIDAGFDALIRSRWETLMAGETVSAAFLLPSRQDFLAVKIREQRRDRQQGTAHLSMQLDAWYDFVAPTTELVYRQRDLWLVRFEGMGSIRDANGRHQAVRIEFPDELRITDVGQAEIDAAKALPLTGRCPG